MKKIVILLLLTIFSTPPASVQSAFVQDADDKLATDTLDMVISVAPDAGSGLLNVQLDLYVFNDGNNLIGTGAGFQWDHSGMRMDSTVLSPVAATVFDFFVFCYDKNRLDTTNYYQRFLFANASMTWPCLAPHPERQLMVSYYFTLDEWSETDSIVVDTLQWGGGTRFGFSRVDEGVFGSYLPVWTGPKVVYDMPSGCCDQRVGDANGLNGDEPTIGDLTVIADALFISGYCDGIIACLAEADVNQSGGADPVCADITIGDFSILQDYLFITGPSLGLPDCL